MVAISLYRGNLHRVPDVPRRWLMPSPKITIRDFKSLLHRRSKAMSRLHSTTSNHYPNPTSEPKEQSEAPTENASSIEPQLKVEKFGDCGEGPSGEEKDQKDQRRSGGGGDCPAEAVEPLPEEAPSAGDAGANNQALPAQTKPADTATPNLEVSNKLDVLNDREKRKREVEDKLQSLNAKKHNLVQALKQILNAEEELKRRNSMQGMAIRPPAPLQVDATNDAGLLTRHDTPRSGMEANLAGYLEGGEAEDPLNHSIHSRHMLRMSSMSPSSESPLRRPASNQHNVVSHPSRACFGATGSPSRFAPTGHQGNPANVPTISVSGTNYIASSPSPAASGGTSAFRDTRLPSPWN